MSTFLDLRTSQGPNATVMSTNAAAPSYIAGIGLIVGSATGIRTQLVGEIGVISTLNPLVQYAIVRQSSPAAIGTFEAANVIFTQIRQFSSIITGSSVSISSNDLNPTPVAGQLTYGLYASASTATTFQGTQSLSGVAASN